MPRSDPAMKSHDLFKASYKLRKSWPCVQACRGFPLTFFMPLVYFAQIFLTFTWIWRCCLKVIPIIGLWAVIVFRGDLLKSHGRCDFLCLAVARTRSRSSVNLSASSTTATFFGKNTILCWSQIWPMDIRGIQFSYMNTFRKLNAFNLYCTGSETISLTFSSCKFQNNRIRCCVWTGRECNYTTGTFPGKDFFLIWNF